MTLQQKNEKLNYTSCLNYLICFFFSLDREEEKTIKKKKIGCFFYLLSFYIFCPFRKIFRKRRKGKKPQKMGQGIFNNFSTFFPKN